ASPPHIRRPLAECVPALSAGRRSCRRARPPRPGAPLMQPNGSYVTFPPPSSPPSDEIRRRLPLSGKRNHALARVPSTAAPVKGQVRSDRHLLAAPADSVHQPVEGGGVPVHALLANQIAIHRANAHAGEPDLPARCGKAWD